jgi:hypothetical protein
MSASAFLARTRGRRPGRDCRPGFPCGHAATGDQRSLQQRSTFRGRRVHHPFLSRGFTWSMIRSRSFTGPGLVIRQAPDRDAAARRDIAAGRRRASSFGHSGNHCRLPPAVLPASANGRKDGVMGPEERGNFSWSVPLRFAPRMKGHWLPMARERHWQLPAMDAGTWQRLAGVRGPSPREFNGDKAS